MKTFLFLHYRVCTLALFGFLFAFLGACVQPEQAGPGPGSSKSITAFTINGIAGAINEADKTINIRVPYGTAVVSLSPVISISPYASIVPASEEARDFIGPRTYTVTAQDGTQAVYTVRVTIAAPAGGKAITGFSINGIAGAINEADKTIDITVPYGTAIVSLSPVISLSPYASVVPASEEARDFSNPKTYTVTAQDGTIAVYTVSVTVALNHANAITGFTINGTAGIINEAEKTVVIELPYGTNLVSLTPLITVSPEASVIPASGTALNFSPPQTYTVTAQNGGTSVYTVSVLVADGADMVIVPPAFEGDISISRSGKIFSATAGFTDHQWYVDGILSGIESSINLTGYPAGKHRVRVMAYKAGVPYSAETLITL